MATAARSKNSVAGNGIFGCAEARFYDANNRTWLAIDPVKDGGNWYQYCFSNPTTYYDPTGLAGFSPFTGCVDVNELTEQIGVEEVNKLIQTLKAIGQYVNGTYTIGIDVSLTPSFWQFDGIIGISIDAKGNIALQGSLMVGPTTSDPAVGILEYKTLTSSSTVYDLEGMTTQIGCSVSKEIRGTPVIAMVGGDFLYIGDPNGNGTYEIGATFSEGIAFSTGKEAHVQWGNTIIFCPINIFDIWNGIYQKDKNTDGV